MPASSPLKTAWLALPVVMLAGLVILSQRKVDPPPEPKPIKQFQVGFPPGVSPNMYEEREPQPSLQPGTPAYEAYQKLQDAQKASREARKTYNECATESNRLGSEAANAARGERAGSTDYYSKEGARRAYEVKRRECQKLSEDDKAAVGVLEAARQEYSDLTARK